MNEISNIHAFEDKDFLRAVVRASGAVAVAGAVLGIALFGFCGVPCELFAGAGAGGGAAAGRGVSAVAWLLGVAAASVAAFALHEGVHAVFFKLFAPAGARVTFGANWQTAMIYACAEGIVYTRRQYLAVTIAPTVLVTALLAAVGVAGGYCFACYLVAVLHLTGCTGDWAYCVRILRDRRITHCEDTSWGVRFLGKDEPGDKIEVETGVVGENKPEGGAWDSRAAKDELDDGAKAGPEERCR